MNTKISNDDNYFYYYNVYVKFLSSNVYQLCNELIESLKQINFLDLNDIIYSAKYESYAPNYDLSKVAEQDLLIEEIEETLIIQYYIIDKTLADFMIECDKPFVVFNVLGLYFWGRTGYGYDINVDLTQIIDHHSFFQEKLVKYLDVS